ncbi:hypothetical protein [Polyangium aurulentum]|uniref:hypothetical protein n=1 Tax=Polyangium aurulentum TaxID=2567896 RepID=UPI0010AEA56E|nr:hypothetical protein [Polyangium aurulentum]UQA59449.1 hypothetical protein E8A73_002770 [Polyangium aurulentum]
MIHKALAILLVSSAPFAMGCFVDADDGRGGDDCVTACTTDREDCVSACDDDGDCIKACEDDGSDCSSACI